MKERQEITTRFASPADAQIVHSGLVEPAASMNETRMISCTSQDIEAALSGDTPNIHAIIAERKGEAIGLSVFFLTFSTWRGVGLGARLLKEVISWGAGQGADHLRLSADKDNSRARGFYKTVGLSLRDNEKIYAIVGKPFTDLGSDS